MTQLSRSLILGVSVLAIAGCGPDDLASPGTGGDVIINNPAPTPTPSPTSSTGTVTAANGCPTIADPAGLTDEGTITGPEGTWRVCAVPLRFTASTTLRQVPGLLYRLPGQVNVGSDGGPAADASDGFSDTNVTLTIEPGVIVFATGASFLNVNRGNFIQANGTATRPIIFTSRDNVLGLNGADSSGQWGGIVISGRAPVTDCFEPAATPGTVNCERQVEGAANPAFFGGATTTGTNGSLTFVQIRYSGFVLSGDNELQSLTTGGAQPGTVFANIQSVNSSDDGVEFFGGYANVKRLIVAGAEDDSLDTDTGVKANMQFVLAAQRASAGDAIIEADSSNGLNDQTPRQNTRIANATFIHRRNNDQVVRLRGGTDYGLYNTLIWDASSTGTPCIRMDDAQTIRPANAGLDDVGPPVFQSVALDCRTDFRSGSNSGATVAQAEAIFDAGTGNNKSYTNTLVNGYLNGANENGFAPIFNVTTLGSFFEAANYIGAVSSANDWTRGWTCDSAAVSFGNNTGSCTRIPVFS
ncbi:hypothetical protein GRI62_11170 [Erythrobacter arachoides]|uniref:Lipoprotein n=1 Tax=Aurantiacibacter arachoides TaxID=1850444 RepID=A0A845A1Z0_9SPHN|nr:hypothetical protein [Aurantiacibacter arachoides]MXO94155.1 hypothetical protein [Aurantiacibacter arachoides]GGD65624.1 hypothetical protein GCM10011411_27520 [Aurantiacibacter arachoides]